MKKPIVVLAAMLVLAAGCTAGEGEGPTASQTPEYWHGGTVRAVGWGLDAKALDPKEYYYGGLVAAIHRCCLLRTLVSYNGRPVSEGGTVVRPDLARELPDVSPDGLTWTFHLKEGLRYAPPFDDTEIVAGDIVRALERRAKPWDTEAWGYGYRFYYSVIQGFDEYWAGEADRISGLETPDEHTLVVHLTEPSGDLGNLFAMAAAAPVPEGAAVGHVADYGRFLVASGPYMIEGSEDVDFSLPPEEQEPAAGFVPGEWDAATWGVKGTSSLALVRNPSWDRTTDPLRPAYAHRIEFTLLDWDLGGDDRALDRLVARIDSGSLDVDVFTDDPSRFERHPANRVLRDTWNVVAPINMNLAVPPFDDVHVRKSVVLAIDRQELAGELESSELYELIGHVAPDGVEGGLLAEWQPDWLSGPAGDLEASRAEMRLSRYDRDGDGRCDEPVCRHVRALVYTPELPGDTAMWSWASVVGSLARIGIRFDATVVGWDEFFAHTLNPSERWGLFASTSHGWIADFPNGSAFFGPLLSGEAVREEMNNNWSMLGTTSDQLAGWGYPVTEVPSVDDRIDRCMTLVGSDQTECWADLDRYLMTEVVPWVPLLVGQRAVPVSQRVEHYSYDQSTGFPALDQIALMEGSE